MLRICFIFVSNGWNSKSKSSVYSTCMAERDMIMPLNTWTKTWSHHNLLRRIAKVGGKMFHSLSFSSSICGICSEKATWLQFSLPLPSPTQVRTYFDVSTFWLAFPGMRQRWEEGHERRPSFSSLHSRHCHYQVLPGMKVTLKMSLIWWLLSVWTVS